MMNTKYDARILLLGLMNCSVTPLLIARLIAVTYALIFDLD